MKILLVDNDAELLQSLQGILESTLGGCAVKTASSGGQAIQIAMAWQGVDLLLADVVMEPMNGFALRDQIKSRFPQAKIFFMSGYDLSDYASELEGYEFFQKPFDAGTLVAAIQRVEAVVAASQQTQPISVPPPAAVPRAATVAPAAAVAPRVVAAPAVAAVPKVTAAPAATAVPRVAAAPVVAAVPKVTAAPAAAAAPRVAAVPAATARPAVAANLQATAAPRAVARPAVATPRAVTATPVAAVAPVVASEPESAVAAPETSEGGELELGSMVGAYQIISVLAQHERSTLYAAMQVSINRPVGLVVLNPDKSQDEGERAAFIADARAKAHVENPAILAVYEAGDSNGRLYFAQEFVEGQSVSDMQASGRKLEDEWALKLLRAGAEGLGYLGGRGVPHDPLLPSGLFLANDGQARIANLATYAPLESLSMEDEMKQLGRMLLTVLPPIQSVSPGLRAVVTRLVQGGENGFPNWGQVLGALTALEKRAMPVEAARITAKDEAVAKAVATAAKQQKRAIMNTVLVFATLVFGIGIAAWIKWGGSEERELDQWIKIPSGTYRLISGKTVTIKDDYWIGKYEVTVNQYAKFLDYLKTNPKEAELHNHPRQPRYLDHTLPNWRIFYERARRGKPVNSAPYDLNCPVVEVNYWDAYAYAKWRGGELPTEEEWEVAAAGAEGFKYPWGNEANDAYANTGSDFNPGKPGQKGAKDGYNYWAPVDKMTKDASPFGVIGMAGNVSEWTATPVQSQDPKKDGYNSTFVIRGGSFLTKDYALTKRITNRNPDVQDTSKTDYLEGTSTGFRIIIRQDPSQK